MEPGAESPLISVVMAVYNGSGTLDAAVASILAQTREDWELIVCDDGSADDTWTKLQGWRERDSRITLLRSEKNLGSGPARNRCISLARGKYIALMDADDLSLPERLDRQAAFLDENPQIAFAGTKGQFFSEKLGDMDGFYRYIPEPKREDFLMTLPFVHASLMFRAETLEALGGYRETKAVTRSEDYDLLLRAYAAGYSGVNLPDPLYGIRLDESTYRRRRYRYRLNECYVKWTGFSGLGLMPRGIAYAIKPLVVGLLPTGLLNRLKKSYYGREKS